MTELAGVLFLVLLAFGVVLAVDMLRDRPTFWPGPVYRDAHAIFRMVHREDRAAYVRIMRRTTYVAMRDLNRHVASAARQIGKALLPAVQRTLVAMEALLSKVR